MRLPNIYAHRNLKWLIAIPLILMILGIYFSFHIPLDSSLRGGVSVTLVTNSNISVSDLAAKVTSVMHIAGVEVSKSPGGYVIILPINQSLAQANNYLANFYAAQANYSSAQLNYTAVSLALHNDPENLTLQHQLANATAEMNKAEMQMRENASAAFAALSPFGITSGNYSISQLQQALQQAYAMASKNYEDKVLEELQQVIPYSSYMFEEVTPTLGRYFLQQFKNIIIVAFLLVFFAVFFIFRSFIPSITVTFGAANDMIIALGAMGLFHIPLGIASIAGLLMIIGYAIDTDVLTAIRIMKRNEGTPEERAYASMRTGLTMTSSAILSFLVLFVISLLIYVPTYYEISSVVLMGLIGDIFTTWFGNASILLLYKKRKERV